MPIKSITNLNISDYPDFIILDSSMLLCVHPKFPNKDRQKIINFLKQIQNLSVTRGLIAVAPTIVFEECYFKIIQLYIKSTQSPLGSVKWHSTYKHNPGIINGCKQEINDFFEELKKIPIVPITVNMLHNSRSDINLEIPMRDNIFSHSILPKDALIIAISDCLEIDNIATMDKDYLRANHLNVYTI